MPTRYSFSGERDEYNRVLRQFRLDKLLEAINNVSVAVMKGDSSRPIYGVLEKKYQLFNKETGTTLEQNVFVSGWSLVDLAYRAILATNDYRGKLVEADNELYALVSALEAANDRERPEFSDPTLSEAENKRDFIFFLWGFAGEQFKFEFPGKVMQNASRELYILLEVAPRIENIQISDVCRIVKEETGAEWDAVAMILYLAWCGSIFFPELDEWANRLNWDEKLDRTTFETVINRYVTTYDEVRKSPLGRQLLYAKPYVRTQCSGTVSINCFLNLFLYEHSILWIVRDYYKRMDDRRFTSEFGRCFEAYCEELFAKYLSADAYSRIPEGSAPRADWKLALGELKFLIEQKSALLGLQAKQQLSNISETKTFVSRNIVRALRQLKQTEEELKDGKCIKVILLYEDYLRAEALDLCFLLDGCDVEDDNYYWLMTIGEMEMFLQTYERDPECFFEVVREKICREEAKSDLGRSIQQLLNDAGIKTNEYLRQEKFLRYRDFAKKRMRKYLPKADAEAV